MYLGHRSNETNIYSKIISFFSKPKESAKALLFCLVALVSFEALSLSTPSNFSILGKAANFGSHNVRIGVNTDYTLSWSRVAGATHYEYQIMRADFTWQTFLHKYTSTNLLETGYLNFNGVPGTKRYRVTACNSNGCSAYTNPISVTAVEPPARPSSISFSGVVDDALLVNTNFSVTWSEVSNVKSYHLQYQRNSEAWVTVRDIGTQTSHQFSFSDFGDYRFRIRSYIDWGGYSDYRTSTTLKILPVAPARPSSASFRWSSGKTGNEITANTKFEITWPKVDAASFYKVFKKEGTDWQVLAENVTNLSYDLGRSVIGQTSYGVSACIIGNCSDLREASITGIAAPGRPARIDLSSDENRSSTHILVSWPTVSGATQYDLSYQAGGDSAPWIPLNQHDKRLTPNSHLFGQLPGPAQIRFRVRAGNKLEDYGPYVMSRSIDYGVHRFSFSSPVTNNTVTRDTNFTVSWTDPKPRSHNVQYRRNSGIWVSDTRNRDNKSLEYSFSDAGDYQFRVEYVVPGSSDKGIYHYSPVLKVQGRYIPPPIPSAPSSVSYIRQGPNGDYNTPVTKGSLPAQTSYRLSWPSVAGASHYRVFFTVDEGLVDYRSIPTLITDPYWEFLASLEEKRVVHRVFACNSDDRCSSAYASGSILLGVPEIPADFSLSIQGESGGIVPGGLKRISWNHVATATKYFLDVEIENSGIWLPITSGDSSRIAEHNFSREGNYRFRYTACRKFCSNYRYQSVSVEDISDIFNGASQAYAAQAFDGNIPEPSSEVLGAVSGAFRVGEGGNASYSIPIAVPKGVGGVQPNLSLNYSSNVKTLGYLGRSWSLSGLSSIYRCPKSYGIDGSAGASDEWRRKAYCYDGQRLILVNGSAGTTGAEYRLERDDFSRVYVDSANYARPNVFRVERSDGTVSFYGEGNAKLGNSYWGISKFEDRVGNRIEYRYTRDSAANAGNKTINHRIDEIHYAFNDLSAGDSHAKVKFNYSDRLAAENRSVVFANDYGSVVDRTIQEIAVYNSINEDFGGDSTFHKISSYVLEYERDERGSRITHIHQCADYDANLSLAQNTCLPATEFKWTASDAADFNLTNPEAGFGIAQHKEHNANTQSFGDFNGDGYQDIFWTELKMFTHDGGPFGSNDYITELYLYYRNFNPDTNQFETSHFTLGGRDDEHVKVFRRDVNRDFDLPPNLFRHIVADFNYDGVDDLAIYADEADQLGNVPDERWMVIPSVYRNGSWQLSIDDAYDTGISQYEVQHGDFNGDGLIDFLSNARVYWGRYDNSGARTSRFDFIAGPLLNYDDLLSTADLDGDGVTEIVASRSTEPQVVYVGSCETSSGSKQVTTKQHVKSYYVFDFFEGSWLENRKAAREINISRTGSGNECIGGRETTIRTILGSHDSLFFRLEGVLYENSYFSDINGDGLADYISVNSSGGARSFQLNRGKDFAPLSLTYAPHATILQPERPDYFLDYDDDGDLDFIRYLGDRIRLFSWEGDGYELTKTLLENVDTEFDRHFFIDINNDSYIDMVHLDGREKDVSFGDFNIFHAVLLLTQGTTDFFVGALAHNLSNPKQTVYDLELYLHQESGPQLAIDKITNGLGESIKVIYENGLTSDHYERHKIGETSAMFDYYVADGDSYHQWLNDLSDTHEISINGPVIEVVDPGYIVASTLSATGKKNRYGSAQYVMTEYYYGSAKVHHGIRGSLGFEKLHIIDNQNDIESTTTYSQIFPFSSLPLSTLRQTKAGAKISEVINKYHYDEMSGSTGASHFFIKKHSVTEKQWNLPVDNNAQGPLLKETTTHLQYDDYAGTSSRAQERDSVFGNKTFSQIIEKGVLVHGGATTDTLTTSITTEYFSGAENLRFGRTESISTSVEKSINSVVDSASTIQRFTYYDNGLIETETNRADTNQAVTSTNSYDDFGNLIRVEISDGLHQRFTETEYGQHHRYVHKTYNSLFSSESGSHVSHVIARDDMGYQTQIEDTHGVSTYAAVDQFGRQYFSASDLGNWETQYIVPCSSECDNDNAMVWAVQETIGNDGSHSRIAMDILGREVLASTLGFDGRWVNQETVYNFAGQVARKSQPYYESESIFWNYMNDYDELSRVTSATVPGPRNLQGNLTSHYSGYCQTDTGPTDLNKTQCSNALGQLVSSEDHEGTRVTYEYDAYGNLEKMYDGNSETNIFFDEYGRKVGMDDPDKGSWHYCYTDFDEMRLQVTANGHAIVEEYDELGRIILREDRRDVIFDAETCELSDTGELESTTDWHYYDISADVGSKGQLEIVELSNGQGTVQYRDTYFYDDKGRGDRVETEVLVPGQNTLQTYHSRQTYDAIGRVSQTYDGSSDAAFTRGGVESRYNAYGYLTQVVEVNDPQNKVYYQINAADAYGNIKSSIQGNGVETLEWYDPGTGQLTSQLVGGGLPGYEVYHSDYQWDLIGNLEWRENLLNGEKETFAYDNLNRLETATIGSQVLETRYDAFGNITYKSDVGDYSYGDDCDSAAGPHAVCSTSDGHSYRYDANGNMTRDIYSSGATHRSFTYSVFDKPTEITKNNQQGARQHTARFRYGPSRSRYLRQDVDTANNIKTTLYLNGVERVTHPNGKVEIKRYIGGKAIVIDTHIDNQTSSRDYQYLHHDHLGSLIAISDSGGVDVNRLSFDAWGARRYDDWTADDLDNVLSDLSVISVTDKTNMGYTGHEMIDELGLVHMNGRIYDPRLARFVQADPIIQDPSYTQSLNRYAYVWNNPLNKTDPSGYYAQAVAVALQIYAAYQIASAVKNFYDALHSDDDGQLLMATFTLGKVIVGVFSGQFSQGPTNKDIWAKIIYDGAIGGIRAKSNGGSFTQGFAEAAVFSGLSAYANTGKKDQTGQDRDNEEQSVGRPSTAAEFERDKFLLAQAEVTPDVPDTPEVEEIVVTGVKTGVSALPGGELALCGFDGCSLFGWGIAAASLIPIAKLGNLAYKAFKGLNRVTKGADVTADTVKNALKGDKTLATQDAVSLPAVQRYVDKINNGDIAPSIGKVGDAVTDGHHRYVAGKVAGKLPSTKPGVMTSAKEAKIQPMSDIKIDPVDWGNR